MSDKKEQIQYFAIIMEERPNERQKRANKALRNHGGEAK